MGGIQRVPVSARRYAVWVWAVCAIALLGPSLLVWIVRGLAYAGRCLPGPGLCRGIALGRELQGALSLSWMIGLRPLFSGYVALLSALAALTARRPLLAVSGLLFLPVGAVILPALAIGTTAYAACRADDDMVRDCLLWGANMGPSFREAASAPPALYEILPSTVALALMVGIVGFALFRTKR